MLNGNIIDIHDDIHGVFHTTQLKEKKASFDLGEAGRSDKKIFAWEEEKRFPLDTVEDIEASYIYFSKTASKIPYYERPLILDKIKKMASYADLDLNSIPIYQEPSKTASDNNEGLDLDPLSDFSISLPKEQIGESIRQKYASFIYKDRFVLYPISSYELVKTANDNFPKGLEGELLPFRSFVATKIKEKCASYGLEPSKAVEKWLPITKSAALEDMSLRQFLFPSHSSHYNLLSSKFLVENSLPLPKFASLLEDLDRESGAYLEYSKNSIRTPQSYLAGVEEDPIVETSVEILLDKAPIPFHFIKKTASSLVEEFPFMKEAVGSQSSFQDIVDSLTPDEKVVLYTKILDEARNL